MGKSIRIGQTEFFSLFVMARLFGSLTFVGEGSMPIDTSTALLGQLVAAAGAFFVLGLLTRLVCVAGTDTPLGLCFLPGRFFGKPAAFVLGVCSFMTLLQVTGSIGYYFSTSAYPKAAVAYFVVLFLAAAMYFNHMGLDAVSRLSNLLFIGLVAVLCLLVVGLWRAVEPVELVSPFYEGPSALGSSIYRSFVDWSDLLLMAMMAPMVDRDAKRPARYVFLVALLAAELISFLLITVFDGYSRMHLFPVQALFAAAELWVPARVDFLYMFIFLAACLIKAAIHLSFVSFCIKTLLPLGGERRSLLLPVLAAGGAALALYYSAGLNEWFLRFMNSGGPMLVMTLLVPLTAFMFRKRKGSVSA